MISQDLNALVCGSTQGIGLAIAQQLAKDGFSVILTARNEAKLKEALSTLDDSKGQKHRFFVSDFSQPDQLKNAIHQFIENYGPIHVLVNIISTSVKQPLPNLGVSNTIRGAVANWSKTLANELAPFGITVNNVLPGATNTQRLTEIAKAKAEKTGESVADILNEMGQESPMKRIAEPQEVAAAVAFLASPAASYINGINVPVDGGRTKSL